MTEAIRWILNDYACVIDGWCYSVTPAGRNACLGKLEDVIKDTPESKINIDKFVDKVVK